MKKTPEIHKVERALDKGVSVFDVSKVLSACVLSGKDIYLLLPRGKWAGTRHGEDACHIEGELAYSYNTNVYSALEALVRLKLIKEADRLSFIQWMNAAEEERRREEKLESLRCFARELGYEVKKLDAVKVKT